MSGPHAETLVLLNPVAGGGRAGLRWQRLQPLVRRYLPHTLHTTSRPGEATTVARQAAAAGVRRILAVGGDGTLHEIINGLGESALALAVLPAGTGNDFARAAGYRLPPPTLLRRLSPHHTRRFDLGQVHDERYLLVAGVGFDASVADLVNRLPRKGTGTVPYLTTAIRHAFRYAPPALRLTIDGIPEPAALPRLMVAVANAPCYAGGMRICPPANPADGRLQLLTVGALVRWQILGLLPRVYTGHHVRDRRVAIRSALSVTIDGATDVPVHADGEIVGTLPATFTIHPGALLLWSPEPESPAGP